MIRNLSPIQLGGTLYIPATHKNVGAICNEGKYPRLRSCIIDTEDAIGEDELECALQNISEMLENYEPKELCVFIRPRSPELLEALLKIKNIEKIDGFSLPKFSTTLMYSYTEVLENTSHDFYIMPVLESRDIFEHKKLEEMRSFLLSSKLSTLTLRLGGEDMMQYLGLKRHCEDDIYSLVAPAKVIADIINTFKPFGFNISATVFNCINHMNLYEKNVREDLRQGLIGKTIIHPNQIDAINEAYKISQNEYDMATKMLNKDTKAIIVEDGQMGEKFAHRSWAKIMLERHKFYGLRN